MHNPYQAPAADLTNINTGPGEDGPQAAGFWRRVGAHFIDTLIMLPIVGLTYWGSAVSRHFYAWWIVPSLVIGLAYSVYLVRRFGGTPGKLLMKLHIQMVDGAPVSLKAAFLRASVIQALALVTTAGLAISALAMNDADYLSMGMMARSQALTSTGPAWLSIASILMQVWIWGGLVVLLANERRRAPHDFLASTVLVRK